MKTIYDQLELGKLILGNRLIRSATWEAMALPDGGPSGEQVRLYEELASGGIGAIITGFTSVDEEDYYFDGMARISNDGLIQRWAPVAEASHKYDIPIIMQLAMGEFVRNGQTLEADDLTADHIQEVIKLFGDAAGRAKNAGFDGVQIHAAHNFYLSRFISPAYNHRTDEYGGNTIGRAKILKDILADMRKKAPGIHITMKINCSDFMPGGLLPEESLEIVKYMADAGLESVEVSANGTSVSGIRAGVNEGYFFDFGKELADQVDIPVILVGGHRSIEHMEEILNNSKIKFLSLSRPLIREPELPKRWKRGDRTPARCVSCNACYRTPGHKCIFVLRGQK
jgi:2,4-dienoyl-CoA reductase-like NADH-dependent reductase (Old Yellow Enzyme family)